MLNTVKRNNFFAITLIIILFSSCLSERIAKQRLKPPRPARDFRIEEIEEMVDTNPAKAIHLIGMYEAVYGGSSAVSSGAPDTSSSSGGGSGESAVFKSGGVPEEGGTPEEGRTSEGSGGISKGDIPKSGASKGGALDEGVISRLREQAVNNLIKLQAKAVEEKRWDDAASLERSLAALGVTLENGPNGVPPNGAYFLAEAKEYLAENNNLAAFLTAVRAEQYGALSGTDAVLFLERAVKARQRRTAVYFLNLAVKLNASVPPELRSYAEGRDSPADMIKGVATVLVDRGIKVEKGRGFNDRVLGSAFFVDASGLLITNYHVISSEVDPGYEGYSRMYIRLGDAASPRIPAKVIGWDKALDLALIKTEYKSSYVFSVVDRVEPQVGDRVLAIGSPVGLEKTVTMGIVSATGRRLLQIGDVIQIDAAVNHGNSGGPVIDTEGRLVGIVFAGIEQFQGLNFAVPAERLAAALPAMIKGGKAKRPWLGLSLAENSGGAEIIYVAPLTPAADLHVPDGVYIKSLNGQSADSEKAWQQQSDIIIALQDSLFQNRPGELVAIETSDGCRRIMQSVERPALPLAEAAKLDSRERMAAPLFGIILQSGVGNTLTPSYLIKKIVRGSIADEAGLSAQDPVFIRGFRLSEEEGYALLDISVKKRLSGYFETSMQLPAPLDSPDTL
ncbi:MAG: S1C family serine protease [Spirochaetaceae bacterium]|nr:S1C family serine protease [Spirochaetaceae bacterium]